MEDTITITLGKPIEDKATKTEWTEITLKEPVLIQVEQFNDKLRSTNNSLTASRFLIHLVSGVSESALKMMTLSDYKKCDAWLNRFFTTKAE